MNQDELLAQIINNQRAIKRQNDEVIWANIFHDTIKGSKWLPADFPFSPGRAAMGYPALYVLYRILDELKPSSILELGLGQSTKMISMYNKLATECHHYIVEHDKDWMDFFGEHFSLPDTTKMVHLDIIDTPLELDDGQKCNLTKYVGFPEAVGDKKYDFICVDGPYGFRSPVFSRIDVLGILPQCLSDSFVIMMDDTERNGERNTVNLIVQTLRENGISCGAYTYSGNKDTTIIYSADYSFLSGL